MKRTTGSFQQHGNTKRMTKTKLALALALALGASTQAIATEIELPRIDVIGEGEQSVARQPGSVAIIDKEALALAQPVSTQDALKSVPGIVIREEEGYGFIPNIGMRGLNPNRSQKVLVLEDGVPIAPGLFLANESYYSPRIERMQSIEVLKGAAGLRYGPTTIGGVINYKTKNPEEGVKVTARAGSHGYQLLGLDAGGTALSGEAIGGISLVTAQGDGFRHNGFDMTDAVVKGGMALGDKQWLSAKFTYYDNEVNTSYVGLRPNEFQNDPTKNPAPNDWFLTDRTSFDLNHELEIGDSMKLNTLLYWSELTRDYWRREVQSRSADGTTFVPCDGGAYCMNGNNRTFEMMGLDSRLHIAYDGFGIKNEAEIGIRLHSDKLDNTKIRSKTDPNARSGDLTSDDTQKANGIAFYGQNRFLVNERIAITPGLRIETYDQERKSELTGLDGKSDNTEVMPGIGATWQVAPQAQLFAGMFKGFSPAMVATAISAAGVDENLDAERSTNFEIGVRGAVDRLSYEATAFHMDFDNQIIPQSESGGVGATVTNAGKTLNQGLEGAIGYDLGAGWGVDTNATWVPTAKFNSTKMVAGIDRNGNRLPYAPKLTSNLALKHTAGGLKSSLGIYHVSSQFVDPENTEAESADGRRGKIPAYTTVNLNAHYAVNKQLSVFGTVRNLLDKKCIASRNPDGIFPGAERNFEAGMSYKF
ncbi:TonB-dependent receptor [Georgfuchsia toluolica]|uniref:TonB-dependent receptor n=1 Tax=Georgfuchsia toluolica TaxID=424218 RepID=A0A916N3Q5_9PROT|nr:TonB-dependent siderophore receptor [Georgfuchsia toluolica]CAG4885341.1 TonB-dependent receptor [Georgfuchsia toluolica]